MPDKDDRDTLEVLKSELNFLEKGGYGRSVREPWKASSVFQDSPTCLCYPDRKHDDCCFLMQLVPSDVKGESVPCHFIPLNARGDTVASLEARGDQEALEEAVKAWLKEQITRLEARAAQAAGK